MSTSKQIEKLVAEFAARKPVRAGSLIISVFGDCICQHGNSVWLGSLITALQPFGINARQIRTAVFRLVQEDWLMSKQTGRKSYYSFTESGHRHYEQAARRIYSVRAKPWNKKWTLLITANVPAEQREQLRKELSWQGFGTISSGLYVHPAADQRAVDDTLQELGLADKVVVFEAGSTELTTESNIRYFSEQCWDLPTIGRRYDDFMQRFRPVADSLAADNRAPAPFQSFLLRTLLIHEYRRVLLHDTDLPDELLPADWPGKSAADLTATIYRAVQQNAVCYITREMQTTTGRPARPGRAYFRRFGGL
ncbi:MAG: phenylacetic acid degradation operon negative regulatory protein PaaX [Gammaproteobacteria bacterium]